MKNFLSKAVNLSSKGYNKAKELTNKGVDATKKAIHDKKKEIALDVIYDVKENLAKGDERKATEKTFNVVEKKYNKGGGVGDLFKKGIIIRNKNGEVVAWKSFEYTIGGL
jgi:hypothetical protein